MNFPAKTFASSPHEAARAEAERRDIHSSDIANALGTLFRFCQHEKVVTHATLTADPAKQALLERLRDRHRALPTVRPNEWIPVAPKENAALDTIIGNPALPYFEHGLLRLIEQSDSPLKTTLDRLATGDLAAAKQVALFARALNQLSNDLQQATNGAVAIHHHVVTFHAAAMQVLDQHPEEHGQFELNHHDIDTTADLTISRGEHIRRAYAGTHAEINAANPHAHQIYAKHQELGATHQIHEQLRTPAMEAAVAHHLNFATQMLVARERMTLDNIVTLPPRAPANTLNKPSTTGVVTNLSAARAQRASGN